MTITTKYNIGDSVWMMEDNKPHQCWIEGISVVVQGNVVGTDIGYLIEGGSFGENCGLLFPSKQALLESL